MDKKIEKFVAYTRVSTLTQLDKGHSMDFQAEKISNYCKLNDIELVKIYKDEGISGAKFRPEFAKAMERTINDNDIDGFITYDFFRFARSVDDLRANIFKLQDANKKFVSLKENFDMTGKFGKLILTIIGAIAEFERDTIIDRMQTGKEYAKMHGTKSGKAFGRPKADIDWDKVRELRKAGLSWTKTAKFLSISTPTLIDRAKKEGIS